MPESGTVWIYTEAKGGGFTNEWSLLQIIGYIVENDTHIFISTD